jgi:hypothetical protein
MSWYGSHPLITKEEARKKLPLRACKRCVSYYRVFPNKDKGSCTRCGNPRRATIKGRIYEKFYNALRYEIFKKKQKKNTQ